MPSEKSQSREDTACSAYTRSLVQLDALGDGKAKRGGRGRGAGRDSYSFMGTEFRSGKVRQSSGGWMGVTVAHPRYALRNSQNEKLYVCFAPENKPTQNTSELQPK